MPAEAPLQPLEPTATQLAGRRVLLNTGALASSSLWRIFISFVLQVLITRILGVAIFGRYVSALAFLNLSQVVSELGLPSLLVRDLARFPQTRRSTYFLALRIQLLSAFAAWLALALLAWVLPLSADTRTALWVVGASLPFYAVTSASETLFQASERMELVMGVETGINALILLLSGLVLWRGGALPQLMGVIVVTQALSAGLCLLLVARHRLLAGSKGRAPLRVSSLLRQARPFFGLAMADVLLQRLDILLLSVLAGDWLVGVYSVAYSLVRVAVKLIQSFWQSLYPTLSRLHQYAIERFRRLSALSLRFGLLIVLPGAALGTALAPELLHLIYGSDADYSTTVFRILIWSAPLFLLETYATTQLMVEQRPRQSLWIIGLHILAVALLLPPLTLLRGAEGAGLAMVLAGVGGTLCSAVLLQRQGNPLRIERAAPLLLASAAAGLAAWLLPLSWPLRLAAGAAIYGGLIALTGVLGRADVDLLRRVLLQPEVGRSEPQG